MPTVAEQIYADMTGTNEAHPHGVPSSYDWANGPVISMGNNPAGNTAFEAWGAVTVPTTGNPATNTRVQLRYLRLYWLNNSGTWTEAVNSNDPEVGLYAEDYSNDYGLDSDVRTETEGISFNPPVNRTDHFYAPFPRPTFDPATLVGVVVVAEARLILDNPSGTDDRSIARYLMSVGADYYPDATGPGIENNPGIAGGKMKFVTSDWTTYAMTTMSLSALTANPPFGSFDGATGGTGGSGGSGGVSGGGSGTGTGGSSGGGPGSAPSIPTFSASPSTVTTGGSSTISFDVTGADTITINGVPVTSPITVNPTVTTEYTLVATNANGTTTAKVTVVVPGESRYPFRYFQTNVLDRLGDGPKFLMAGEGDPQPYEIIMYDDHRNAVPSGGRGVHKGDWIIFGGGTAWGILPVGVDGYLPVANAAAPLGILWDSPSHVIGSQPRQGFIAYFLPGKPGAAAYCYVDIPGNLISFKIPANFTAAYGKVGANPTATAVYTFYQSGSTIGTASISTSGVFTWATASGAEIIFTPGSDELSWKAPDTQDTTLSDVRFGIPVIIS